LLNDKNNPSADTSGTANAERRIHYLITEDTQPAPMGSSLRLAHPDRGRRTAKTNSSTPPPTLARASQWKSASSSWPGRVGSTALVRPGDDSQPPRTAAQSPISSGPFHTPAELFGFVSLWRVARGSRRDVQDVEAPAPGAACGDDRSDPRSPSSTSIVVELAAQASGAEQRFQIAHQRRRRCHPQ
jgi:hypothetical protein